MKIEGDYAILSTGKRLFVNCGIIGLAPDGGVTGGYDQDLMVDSDVEGDEELTPAERKELADYMQRRWYEYGERL